MRWLVDPTSPSPLFEQVAQSVRDGVASGVLEPGDRLPAARDLADSLDVNVHTVLRAYQTLRDERLLDLRRGRGAIVLAPPPRPRLEELLDQLVAEGRRHDLAPHDLARLLEGRHP